MNMKQNEWDLRNLFAEDGHSRARLLVLIVSGLAAGLLTTFSGDAYDYGLPHYLFGEATMGLLFWAVSCTLIAVSAKTPLHAAGGVLCYLSAMLFGCVAAERIFGCWMLHSLLHVRMLALLPAGLLGLCTWYLRRSETLRIAAAATGFVMLLFDIVFVANTVLPVVAAEGMLYFVLLTVLRHLGEDQREQILYRRNFLGSCEPLNRF